MNPAEFDIKKLKGLSKNDLARLVLKLGAEVAEKDCEIEFHKREIERHEAFQDEIAAVMRQLADNAEQMKLHAQEYYLTFDDPVATDIDAQIGRMVVQQIKMVHQLYGLADNMKPGSEKSNVKRKPQPNSSSKAEAVEDEDDIAGKKPRRSSTPVEHMRSLLKSLEIVDMNTPVGEVIDLAQKIIAENTPAKNENGEGESDRKKNGRCRNIDQLEVEEFQFADVPITSHCPQCGGVTLEASRVDRKIKTQRTVMKAREGVVTPIRLHNYWCPNCQRHHTFSEGSDHPIAHTRTMGVKPIVTALHLHYMGLALNRAGTSFEKGALLGSDTLNRNAYEWGLIYIMPLYEALLNKLREQKVLAADETCFNVAQPMGYGKKPEDGKNSPGTCSQTYVLSFGTVFRSMVQLHAYALLEGRGTDAIAKYLDATFKFTALVTDAYGAYGKLLENHPDALHQICLIHCRRYLMTHGSNVQGARDFLDLTPEQQAAVMEKARRENGVFYKEARIYQSISLIYQWEKEIVKARGDPQKLAEIRRKQTALMDLIDKLMDELSEGRVEQSESGRWRASPKTDPLAKACVFYRNNRDKLRCFLKEDNFEIPPDSSVVEQNIRPIALIRNNSHFFTNADYAKVALATFSIFRTLEMNHIDPLEWMEKYCRRLFEHITARGLDRLYLDTGDPEKTWITVRQEPKPGEKASPYCLSSYAADFDFASCIDEIIETGIENRKKLEEAQQQ